MRKDLFSKRGEKDLRQLCEDIGTSFDCIGAAQVCDQNATTLRKLWQAMANYSDLPEANQNLFYRQVYNLMTEWAETKSGLESTPDVGTFMGVSTGTDQRKPLKSS